MTPEAFVKQTNLDGGKSKGACGPTGWPGSFTYGYNEERRHCTLTFQESDKRTFKRAEPWGLAFLSQMQQNCDVKVNGLDFFIKTESSGAEVEAFRRRVSFLSIANPRLSFSICRSNGAGGELVLYAAGELYSRPDDEVIHRDVGPRHDTDRPGRLEKDFQTWLFGKGLKKDRDERTNERLAILGDDFFKLSKKKFKLTREFPTGAFRDKISGTSRILPTEFVDIVTLNRHGRLAVVELKIDDPGLHVISQLLNYALFFRSYFFKLQDGLKEELGAKLSLPINCYVVNNRFHPRFEAIRKYYSADKDRDGFLLKQVVLGKTLDL